MGLISLEKVLRTAEYHEKRLYPRHLENAEIVASYDQDSKRYHRYMIDEGQGIVGNIYIPKGKDIPKVVKITHRVKD